MPAVPGEHSRHDFKLNDGGLALLMPVPPDQTAHLVNVKGSHGYAVDGNEDVAHVDGAAAVGQAGATQVWSLTQFYSVVFSQSKISGHH